MDPLHLMPVNIDDQLGSGRSSTLFYADVLCNIINMIIANNCSEYSSKTFDYKSFLILCSFEKNFFSTIFQDSVAVQMKA